MKKIFAFIFIISLLIPTTVKASAKADFTGKIPPPEGIGAHAVYISELGNDLMNSSDDTVLYSQNSQERLYPASLTKIMTAVVVLSEYSPEQMKKTYGKMTNAIKQEFFKMGAAVTGLTVNADYLLNDLFYCMLINSGADSTQVLVDSCFDGNNVKFIEAMNEKAAELGMSSTNFTNITGLHDDNNYTTAEDMFKLAVHAMYEMPYCDYFKAVVSQKGYAIPAADKTPPILVSSRNLFLTTDRLAGIIGIKTGTTSQAGECLITAYDKDDLNILTVTMKSEPKTMFIDNRKLYTWALNSFVILTDLNEINTMTVPVKRGADGIIQTKLEPIGEIRTVVPRGYNDKFEYKTKKEIIISAPSGSKKEITEAQLILLDQQIGAVKLYTTESINMSLKYLLIYFVSISVGLLIIVFTVIFITKRKIYGGKKKKRIYS